MSGISWGGVLLRIVLAIALVLLTFNPSGHSFYHWISAPPPAITAVKAFAAVALLIAWIVCLRTALVALALIGVGVCAALLVTCVGLLFDPNVLQTTDSTSLALMVLVILGIVLGIGLSS